MRRSVLAQNALALYGVQAAMLLLPLITIPYLARVLRPAGWGLVVFSQSLAVWLSIILQFGFALSATRRVARYRDRPERLTRVVAGVQTAKVLLFCLMLLAAAGVAVAIPVFHRHLAYLVWAVVGAAAQGFIPLWYFQGVERLGAPAGIDVFSRMLATAGIFLWVRTASDGWRVLALNACAGILTLAITTFWLYREMPLRRSSLRHAIATLRNAWGLFVFTGAASLYTVANSFILGVLAGPVAVAFYGSGEKVIRASISMLSPLSQALFPRVSHLMVHDPAEARRLVRLILLPIGGLGVALGIAIAVEAPLITRLLFGPGYAPVVTILRILAPLLPVQAFGTVLGIQWVLPLGREAAYNRLVISAGVCNLVLAAALVPWLGAVGMAISAVLSDALVTVGLVVVVMHLGDSPWKRALSPAVPSRGS